jgi:ubiquinone/menaquinone biosynthesis C-methylase UbiE
LNGLIASLLTIFFRLLYNQFACLYDLVANLVSAGLWFQWVNAALPYLIQEPILELGFGTGKLQEEINKLGENVIVGLDRSMNMAKITDNRLRRKGFLPNIVNGDARNLPFNNESFPSIVATFPSPYILESQVLHEIQRVLSPGGHIVIIPLAWITGKSLAKRIASGILRLSHQSPPRVDDIEDPFKDFYQDLCAEGFRVNHLMIDTPDSKVVCIIAKKPISNE